MNSKKYTLSVVFILIIISVFMFGLNKSSESKVKIGLAYPLTGPAASWGESALAGTQLALEDLVESGVIEKDSIELVVEDTKCNPTDGVNVYNKLITLDKVDIILGPVCSAVAQPAIKIAQANSVPNIIWGSAPGLPQTGDYIFRTYPSDLEGGKQAARMIYKRLGKKKAAIISVKTEYGQGLRNSFKEAFTELGGEVVFDEGINEGSRDIRSVLIKMSQQKPDILYFTTGPAEAIMGIPQIRNLGITIPVVGNDTFEDPKIFELEEAQGMMYHISKFSTPDDFMKRVKEASGIEPMFMASLGYDAMNLVGSMLATHGSKDADIKGALSRVIFEDSIAVPQISFDTDGNLKDAVYEFRVISEGKGELYGE